MIALYTDGACKGNPGPGGWGFHYLINGALVFDFGGEADTTNNRMELLAAIKGLESISADDVVEVEIITDSNYLIKGMTEWIQGWQKKGWKTSSKEPVKNVDLWKVMLTLTSTKKIKWTWVKGHSNNPGNEMADMLANKGVASL